nr:rhamnogalacturonan acetylesterase [Paenibacillus humicola]
MADYPPEQAPMAGWGQMLGRLITGGAAVRNEARCGRSSKSFIREGHFTRITASIGKGDYLFIQFGHNDEKPGGTEPFTTFQAHLRQYVDAARQSEAEPVLFTPVERRRFDGSGKLAPTHGHYPAAVRELAAAMQVPLIDLTAATGELYRELGPEASKRLFVWLKPGEHANYPDGAEDNTHFNETGAVEVARLAVRHIAAAGLPLAAFFRNKQVR